MCGVSRRLRTTRARFGELWALLFPFDSWDSFDHSTIPITHTQLNPNAGSTQQASKALLLACGGETLDLDQDRYGDTALHFAVKQPYVMKALLRAGVNPTIRNHQGQTPLQLARRQNNKKSIAIP